MSRALTDGQQAAALDVVAAWLGPQMGYDFACPTGRDAAHRAAGPMLIPDWDWPASGPTPTIILEGGPEDWAIWCAEALRPQLSAMGIFAEPYASYALCLYPGGV